MFLQQISLVSLLSALPSQILSCLRSFLGRETEGGEDVSIEISELSVLISVYDTERFREHGRYSLRTYA